MANFFSFFVSYYFSLFSQFLIEWIKAPEQEGHLIRAFSLQSVQFLNPMVSHCHLSFIHRRSRGWGVYRGAGVVGNLPPVGCFPMIGRFIDFQRRGGELGRGDDREGCRLVTIVDGSCLGVVGRSALKAGETTSR